MEKEKGKKGKQLTHRIHVRVTEQKYEELFAIMRRSRRQHSMSELLRDILDNRKIVVHTYDATMDMVMAELSQIRTELNAIGVNINQVTYRFHSESLPESRLMKALEIAKLYQQTDLKVSQLFTIIAKLSEQWLPR